MCLSLNHFCRLNQLPRVSGDVSGESPGLMRLASGCNSYFGVLLQLRTLTLAFKQHGPWATGSEATKDGPVRVQKPPPNLERGDRYPVRKGRRTRVIGAVLGGLKNRRGQFIKGALAPLLRCHYATGLGGH
jgi:hypothetical protein